MNIRLGATKNKTCPQDFHLVKEKMKNLEIVSRWKKTSRAVLTKSEGSLEEDSQWSILGIVEAGLRDLE